MSKNSLRKRIKNKRNSLTKPEMQKQSSLILKQFKGLMYDIVDSKGGFVVYLATQSEVKTAGIINFLHKQNRKVYAPCVTNSEITPSCLTKGCKFKKCEFDIYEPEKKSKIRSLKNIAAVIIPGIAFDTRGNRLGFGKGFFDKFLKKLPEKTLKIALAFSCQIVKQVPAEAHDVKMDFIITENGIYECTEAQ